MPPRFHCPLALPAADAPASGEIALPAGVVRHVQVRRLQPGDALELFDGNGRAWRAELTAMARSSAHVRLCKPIDADAAELPLTVQLAIVMPANDRMDALVEKATELGAHGVQPLMSERSVLRLSGERADKKGTHWQAVAAAAAEQCGRGRVPSIAPVQTLTGWLAHGLPVTDRAGEGDGLGAPHAAPRLATQAMRPGHARWLLSPRATVPLATQPIPRHLWVLSGPEGGLSDAEEAAAQAQGFLPVTLGPRVLRADTAPLAVLAWLGVQVSGSMRD